MTSIQAPLDNGNIIAKETSNPTDLHVEIRKDNNNSEHSEWFNFTLEGTPGDEHVIYIDNAGDVSFPDWEEFGHYDVYASYDDVEWFNLPTTYDAEKGQLRIQIDELKESKIHLAFFPAYNYARHLELIETARNIPHCSVTHLGKTTFEEGRDITLLTFGTPAEGKKEIWLIARQHPGEPQAQWYAEQLVQTLKDKDEEFFEQYTIRLVPNMNPDGTYLGNLRTNGHGVDLNRQWHTPSMESSPEVFLVLQEMERTGVDFFMDIHSDEAASEIFFPGLSPKKDESLRFVELYKRQNPLIVDFEYEGSGLVCPEITTMQDTADGGVSTRFNCPSFTLEMPTKNWTIGGCYQLAEQFFTVLEQLYAEPSAKQEEKREATVERPVSPGQNSIFHHKASGGDSSVLTSAPAKEEDDRKLSGSPELK